MMTILIYHDISYVLWYSNADYSNPQNRYVTSHLESILPTIPSWNMLEPDCHVLGRIIQTPKHAEWQEFRPVHQCNQKDLYQTTALSLQAMIGVCKNTFLAMQGSQNVAVKHEYIVQSRCYQSEVHHCCAMFFGAAQVCMLSYLEVVSRSSYTAATTGQSFSSGHKVIQCHSLQFII